MSRFLLWALLFYFGFSLYLIHNYEKMNDKLQKVNMTLLNSCINGQITPSENERYK